MIKKIDINSSEFQEEFKKTEIFTDKVISQFGFSYNPQDEINESIQQGLTRNKLIYGKRYCPCFMVIGETKEERKKADNRICPCKPGLEIEMPRDGKCHCGIFCTPEYAKKIEEEIRLNEVTHTHSRNLSQQECDNLLMTESIDSNELESLLEARDIGCVNFLLVDVREWLEWKDKRIKGTDYLIPTTSFYESILELEDKKDKTIIVYCYSGSRSEYCQYIMHDLGFKKVINLEHGILTYKGETTKGEKTNEKN